MIGREFELSVLAEAAGVPEDDVLDLLDPALAAGLVREDGVGRYVFGHALVRDTVYDAWSADPPRAGARPGRRGARGPRRSGDRGGSALAGRRSRACGPGVAGGLGRGDTR